MKHPLERRYGLDHLHFITCSCYRRKPLLGTPRARNVFLKILSEAQEAKTRTLGIQRVAMQNGRRGQKADPSLPSAKDTRLGSG
ncbi:MAG TPA: hypothetical protein VLY23_07795 [Candidatus Acidoferrum sp.]|nr:hypothetical protein [Candidatus Acidoferrum sp.]